MGRRVNGTRPTNGGKTMQTQENTVQRDGAVWLAGEASGDLIASMVIPEVQRRMEGALQYGIGGPKMREVGFRCWHDINELSVRGYVEVLAHLPRLLKLRRSLGGRIADSLPRVFVGVDAPDFNLGLETELRRRQIPVVHLVSPSIWAWRPERIQTIRRAVDHMLLVFPFEEEIYRKAGIPATFVGHPLASMIPEEPDTVGARTALNVPLNDRVLTVMPGSRASELSGCAPIFFDAVERLMKRSGPVSVIVPAIDDQAKASLEQLANQYPRLAERLTVVVGQSHRAIEASDVVLVASGTAALECALYKKPMVVGYKMPGFTGLLMEKKGLIDYVSLPNILARERLVPEFLQYFCEPDAISWSIEDALTNDKRRAYLVERFQAMHASLRADTANLAADVICQYAQH